MSSPVQELRRTTDMVVQMYAVDSHDIIIRDWRVGLSLLYNSAFLPPDAVFRHHAVNGMITSRCNTRGVQRLNAPVNILYQSEILEKILIPHAQLALKDNDRSRIRHVLDLATSMLGSLGRSQRPSNPALECLIFSILWHLGYEQEMGRFLESRCRFETAWKASVLVLGNSWWDAGNIVLANLMAAVASEIPFGIMQAKKKSSPSGKDHRAGRPHNSRLYGRVKMWSSRLLLVRVTNVNLVASHLLMEGRVMDAMTLCLRYERASKTKHDSSDRRRKHASKVSEIDMASLIDASRRVDAKLFVDVTLWSCSERKNVDQGKRDRALSCLKAFLSRQDPDPIGRVPDPLAEWKKRLSHGKQRSMSYDGPSRKRIESSQIPLHGDWFHRRRHSFQSGTTEPTLY